MASIKLLALDTSTEACSAALAVGPDIIERYEVLPRGHAERVLGMIQSLLAEAGLALVDVDALAFCRGPGSFTGVRIGVGVAQGLALGADLPVAPVSTLAALAQGALRQRDASHVLAAIDARMGEVYWGAFRAEGSLMHPLTQESVSAVGAISLPPIQANWVGVGTGWGAYSEEFAAQGLEGAAVYPEALARARDCLPFAAWMRERGELVAPEAALPVYLRDRVTG